MGMEKNVGAFNEENGGVDCGMERRERIMARE